MNNGFFAVAASPSVLAELSAASPANPYATPEFFESKRRMGFEGLVIGVRDGAGALVMGCGAFLRAGRLNSMLEIESLPAVTAESVFWTGLRQLCAQRGITQLLLETYASPLGVQIPEFGTHCTSRSRGEFVLDLAGDPAASLRSNHKRNVKKAGRAGISVVRTRSTQALETHQSLRDASMDRRRARGESVSRASQQTAEAAYLESGAGELFQAVLDGSIVSSVLVLRARKGGYYQSAGTTSAGMSMGASHFLIHSISLQLKADGADVFTLGGADEGSSLARFKSEFGATRIPLPEMTCYVGPAWRRKIGAAIALAQSDRRAALRVVTGNVSSMTVYSAESGALGPAQDVEGLEFRALSAEDLQALTVGDADFRTRQLDRLQRFGASHAHAVFADGQIAHICWLLPKAAIERDEPRVVQAREHDAEITGCETLPAFRGRGIYQFSIKKLFEVARAQGVRRVYMKTASDNAASRAGIEKAGLARVGTAIMLVPPLLQRRFILRRFR